MRSAVDQEARIADLRMAGLYRLVAQAENRALKMSVERGNDAAAPVRSVVARYRAEMVRLAAIAAGHAPEMPHTGSGTGTPAEDDGCTAAEDAVRRLQLERELEQLRIENDQARTALAVAQVPQPPPYPVTAGDRVAEAARLLRGMTLKQAREAVVQAALPDDGLEDMARDDDLASADTDSSGDLGTRRTPRRAPLSQFDQRRMRWEEVSHAA